MIVIHVAVKVKENVVHEFEDALRGVVSEARKTTGCEKYEWYLVPDFPLEYVIYGEFSTKENFINYLNSAVVKRIEEQLIPILSAPPAFKHYEATIFEGS